MSELTVERKEALIELINVSFGLAVAALAELLDVHITISVPEVSLVNSQDVFKVLGGAIAERQEVTLVQQAFNGDILGEAVLALSGRSSDSLVAMLTGDGGYTPQLEGDKLKQEALLEVGNILIGACMGQFCHLLNARISYHPPRVFFDSVTSDRLKANITSHKTDALMVCATFSQEELAVTGYLFFFLPEPCLGKLFCEIDEFLKTLQ